MTPLIEETFNNLRLFLKLDYLSPSGSFKDRGATVMVSKLRELGIAEIVEDSSGNAGSAIALYCARAGIRASIYVPASVSAGKLAQIAASGATIHRIEGTREDVARAALAAAERSYYASHSWSPFFFHGTKTFAFEVCEQLDWQAPDVVISPVGNGTLLLGAFIGFCELRSSGVIEYLPTLIGAQSEGCAPIHKAWETSLQDIAPMTRTPTIAEGIAVARPVRGRQILRAIRETGGRTIVVNEQEILEALKILCRRGYYVEPTAAVALAGAMKMKDDLQGKTVVVPLTGSGLKAGEQVTRVLQVAG
jgi:threonine synthase